MIHLCEDGFDTVQVNTRNGMVTHNTEYAVGHTRGTARFATTRYSDKGVGIPFNDVIDGYDNFVAFMEELMYGHIQSDEAMGVLDHILYLVESNESNNPHRHQMRFIMQGHNLADGGVMLTFQMFKHDA